MRVCGMEKQSLSRFMLSPSHVSSLCGCQMDFCVFITKPASVSDFLTTRECMLDCTLSADPSPSSIKTNLYSLSSPECYETSHNFSKQKRC